jgi:PTH1 family peptidyl-tRNA hydrolase
VRVVFGIGNPGNRYQLNRHNAGFLFLDYFAKLHSLNFIPSKGECFEAVGKFNQSDFILIKPTTYVNNSGFSALYVLEKYELNHENIVVICDDVNLSVGTQRVRLSGGDGGHNGLSSIIYHLNFNEFPRIRIGVGKNINQGELSDHVLSDFEEEEFKHLEDVFVNTAILVQEFIVGGNKKMLEANSKFNKSNIEENSTSNSNGR